MRLFRLLRLVSAMLLPFGLASAAGLPAAKQSIVVKNEKFDLKAEYPQTGIKAIDTVLAAYAHQQVDQFRKDNEGFWEKGHDPFYLLLTYKVERNDAKIFAVVFDVDSFAGGAHPNQDTATFNFLLPDGARVFLPEIVGRNGIDRISKIVIADLTERIGTNSDADTAKMLDDMIKAGAGPDAENFKNFVWLPNALHLYFPPYQVASYAEGPQEATIPLSQLKDVIRPDWHAPAPSFDCAKAATAIEHAICADAMLARLDRQVAELYQAAMHNAYDQDPKAALLKSQREWLARRNKVCGTSAPGACLTKLYRDRLAVLRTPPT